MRFLHETGLAGEKLLGWIGRSVKLEKGFSWKICCSFNQNKGAASVESIIENMCHICRH